MRGAHLAHRLMAAPAPTHTRKSGTSPLAATATAFAVLFLAPWGVATTVVVALFAGPIAGALVHLAGLVR